MALVPRTSKLVPAARARPAVSAARPLAARKARAVVASASGMGSPKVLKGPYIVKITSGNIETDQAIPGPQGPNGTLLEYLTTSINTFPDINLPAGGSLKRVDAQNFVLTAPKLELFDLWLQPQAAALVRVNQQMVEVIAGDCVLQGSQQVESLKMNDLFIVDVKITFSEKPKRSPSDETRVISKGCISVDVDVPSPFNLMPAFSIEAVGNAALTLCLNLILNSITGVLVSDYSKWAAAKLR